MKKLKLKVILFILIFILSINSIIVSGIKNPLLSESNDIYLESDINDNFYFVQLTDTHVKNKIFDINESSSKRLKTALDTIKSFENKPAFIVITGDLTEWGAGLTGALNCITFTQCFFEKDNQLYADDQYTIPVYTSPGNHDYVLQRNLDNYHKYIDSNHVESNDRYVVEYGDISLFFMNSGPNYYSNISILFQWHGQGLSDEDIEWLENELSNSQSKHKIILMHHPAVGEAQDLFIDNRQEFVNICEANDVEMVLAGHTHRSKIYDFNLTVYSNILLNCSDLPTLYIQSDDCKQGCHFRNVTIIGDDVWLGKSEEISLSSINDQKNIELNNYASSINRYIFLNILKDNSKDI